MVDLDEPRVVAVTEGRDKGSVGRLCDELEGRGGDSGTIVEVTRDMAEACARNAAAEMPQAAQTVDRLHTMMQLAARATGRVRCRESWSPKDKRRLPRGTKRCWTRRPENLTERQTARKESLMGEHLPYRPRLTQTRGRAKIRQEPPLRPAARRQARRARAAASARRPRRA